jgi:hypothetical protein
VWFQPPQKWLAQRLYKMKLEMKPRKKETKTESETESETERKLKVNRQTKNEL